MVLYFWYPHLVLICQLNLSTVFQFRHPHLCMDRLTRFIGNSPRPSEGFWILSASKSMLVKLNCVGHSIVTSSQSFPFQKVLLDLDLVTLRVFNLDAWFNSHFDFNEYHILRFENHALISFFLSYPEPQSTDKSVIL